MKVKPTDLTPSSYNPRVFNDKARDALKSSMETFNDISGITYNSQSGNIVGGHHRWEELVELYGIKKLKFENVKGTDRYLINTKDGEFTGYLLRVVDWDEATEKAANVTANSHAVEGEFTSDLQEVLADIRDDFDETLFSDLRLDELEVNIKPIIPDEEDEEEEDTSKTRKSETMISGGGDKYITVKMELSPELADRLHAQLDRFRISADSVEEPLAMMMSFIEWSEDSAIRRFQKKVEKLKPRKKRTRR